MAANRPQKTLADYVAIAICPALIMALVGSLMFFLLEVFHKGPHDDRLRWAVSCFVIGVVLIARISMMSEISDRASLYGLALGVAAYLVVNKYIEYPASNPLAPIGWLVNLLIMAVVWWSAHRLTWDCTLIDEEADASGQGLLQAAGLEQQADSSRHAPRDDASRSEATTLAAPDDSTDLALSWWERFRARRQKRMQGHTPGIWIVYYSLAALPLFGLGQLMIPESPADRRRYAFWLLAIYVSAGLSLLLATSFLGLRRYLRQRKVQMPAAMTGVWFMVGAGFVGVLLALAFLLPRPSAEYFNVVALLTGEEHKASEFDVLGGKGAKGKGQQSGKGPGEKPGGTTPGKTKGAQGKKSDQQSKSSDQGDKHGDESSAEQGKDGKSSKSGNSKNSREGKSDKSGKSDSKNNSNKGEQKDSAEQKGDGAKKHDSDAGEKKPGDQRDKPTDEKREETKDEQGGNSEQQPPPPPEEESEADEPESLANMIASIVKWIVYILAALVVLYVLIRHWRKVLAMLQGAWQALLELWAWLLGRLGRPAKDELSALENPGPEPPPPFSSFSNPFLSGMVETKSVNYVTRYTFAALQAWAYERGLGREPGETPIEFCQRLTDDIPAFEQNARRLGENYSRVSYARATLGRPSLDALEALWQRLTLPVREAAGVGS